MRADGYDLEAMRRRIQWEARQLITSGDLKSTEVEKRCNNREILKVRQPLDYIQINEVKRRHVSKDKVVPNLSIPALIRLQARIRGALARIRFPRLEWILISEYMHVQADAQYNVKVFKSSDTYGKSAKRTKRGDNRK